MTQNQIKIYINKRQYLVPKDLTILQACESVGIEIPRFCYHKELLIAGNCRMCLVELEKSPKPVASCAMQIMPNMVIYTNTPLVKKARESVLEFLLLNHPLDCPICDQAGECDLQDQSLLFGSDRGRFFHFKRTVEDKNCGPLIKTIMTRCIHCTRCVRFISEVAGLDVLGTTNRGNKTEIGTYIQKNINSELSGNLIDLCPVGALTSKPYAFRGRAWELKNQNTVDILDGLGSNTITQTRGKDVMRILPGINHQINKEWISDKVRFSFDSSLVQRIQRGFFNGVSPLVREWRNIMIRVDLAILDFLKKDNDFNVFGVYGKLENLENIFALKNLVRHYGDHNSQVISETFNQNFNSNYINDYTFTNSLTNFDQNDLCVLIGTNLRNESVVLNSHLRKRYIKGNFEVYHLGTAFPGTFPIHHVGLSIKDLNLIVEGRHGLSKKISQAKNPIFIIGSEIYNHKQADLVSYLIKQLKSQLQIKFGSNWDNFNHLHSFGNSLVHHEFGFTKRLQVKPNKKNIIFLLGTDDFDLNLIKQHSENNLVILIGAHGTKNAEEADVVLPMESFDESRNSYLNVERRLQISEKVANTAYPQPGWALMYIIGDYEATPFKTKNMRFESKQDLYNTIVKSYGLNRNKKYRSVFSNKKYFLKKYVANRFNLSYNFNTNVENFYLNDPFTKNSKVMGRAASSLRCTKNFITNKK